MILGKIALSERFRMIKACSSYIMKSGNGSEHINTMKEFLGKFVAGGLAAGFLFGPLSSQSQTLVMATAWQQGDFGASRLITGTTSHSASNTFMVGIQLRLKSGWKTYWRSPGDAGEAPRLDWSHSANVAEHNVLWPMPHRFSLFGLDTLGYEGDVVLPVEVRARDGNAPLRLLLDIKYAVCKDICLPMKAHHALEIAALSESPADTIYASLIRRYLEQVPTRSEASHIRVESALIVSGDRDEQVLEVTARAAHPFLFPEIVVEGPESFHFGTPDWQRLENGRHILFRMPIFKGNASDRLAGKKIRITLADGAGTAIDREIAVGKAP